MTIEQFIITLEPEFDELKEGSLTPQHEFKNIEGWSSMLSLIIVSKINKTFKVSISSQELINAKTIEDLYLTTLSKLQTV